MALKVGGTEVISNSRQLSNIASVDATTVAALGTAGVGGGGGEFDAVASGNISNGDLVVLNSNGTVSTHQGFMSDKTDLGTTDTQKISAVFDSSNNKIVVAYDDNTTGKGMAVVGTVSNNAITFGTPVEWLSTQPNYTTCLFDSNSNKIVIGYTGVNSYVYAVVGTVSGTSISFGSNTTIYGASAAWLAGCFDSNVNKCAFFFRNTNNQGAGIVATVSGTSLTSGSVVQMEETGQTFNINNTGANFDSNNNKCLVAFRHATDSNKGYSIVATVASSGNSLSFGQPVKLYDNTVSECEVGFDSNVNKSVITWRDANVDNKIRAAVTSISGTVPSYGTTAIVDNFAAGGISNNRRMAFDSNLNKLVFVFLRAGSDNDKRVTLGTISGTDITFSTPQVFDTSAQNDATIAFDSNANQSVIFYNSNATGSRIGSGKVVFGDYGESFFNWVGITQAAISNGATGTITVLGGVSENQSGLTVGSAHYLKDDGTFSTTAASGREVGKAISATKMLLTSATIT